MNGFKILFLLVICSAAFQVANAFIGTKDHVSNIKSHERRIKPPSMVFERMSENCIGAIVTAQKQAQKFSQREVEVPFLVADPNRQHKLH